VEGEQLDVKRPVEATESQVMRDAERLGLDAEERETWLRATPKMRGLMKAQHHRRLKGMARKFGLNPERFLELNPEQRDEAVSKARAEVEAKREAVLQKHSTAHQTEPELHNDVTPRVYSDSDDVPATEQRAGVRDGVSIGRVTERHDDLFGDRPPRTLTDMYARWPIGRPGGEDFSLRVERLQPKKHNGVDCSGYLGDIRNIVVNESLFARYFGGREYHVQVYGPHPQGRRDANGDIIIKALTDPVLVTVPHLPPNLSIIPSAVTQQQANQDKSMPDLQNPFAAAFPVQQQPPTTQSDASIFKSATDFVSRFVPQQQPKSEDGTPPKHVFDWMATQTNTQAELAKHDSEARERILRDQLVAEQKRAEEVRAELQKFKDEFERARNNGGSQTVDILKLGEGSNQRIHDHYRFEIQTLRTSHDDQLKTINERHHEEIRRMEERIRDSELTHRAALDEERRRREEDEKRLRKEMADVRQQERDDAERRIREAKERADERMKDIEKAHERELRTEQSNAKVVTSTEKTRLEYEIEHLKTRADELQRDLDEAKEEAEKHKDPVAVVNEWEHTAKKMGWKKGDEEAEKPWQTLLNAAGAGIGQALGKIDPNALLTAFKERGQPGPQRRQMPPQQQRPQLPPQPGAQGQQRAPVAGPSRRAMQWASQGLPVAAPDEAVASPSPRPPQAGGASPIPPGVVGPGGEEAVDPARSGSAAPPPPVQHEPPQAEPAQPEPRPAPELPKHKLVEAFGSQAALGFLQAAEGAINSAVPPAQFVDMLFQQYPEPARRLGGEFSDADAIELVEEMAREVPEVMTSPILRKDGRKWLQQMWEALRGHSGTPAPDAQPVG